MKTSGCTILSKVSLADLKKELQKRQQHIETEQEKAAKERKSKVTKYLKTDKTIGKFAEVLGRRPDGYDEFIYTNKKYGFSFRLEYYFAIGGRYGEDEDYICFDINCIDKLKQGKDKVVGTLMDNLIYDGCDYDELLDSFLNIFPDFKKKYNQEESKFRNLVKEWEKKMERVAEMFGAKIEEVKDIYFNAV